MCGLVIDDQWNSISLITTESKSIIGIDSNKGCQHRYRQKQITCCCSFLSLCNKGISWREKTLKSPLPCYWKRSVSSEVFMGAPVILRALASSRTRSQLGKLSDLDERENERCNGKEKTMSSCLQITFPCYSKVSRAHAAVIILVHTFPYSNIVLSSRYSFLVLSNSISRKEF